MQPCLCKKHLRQVSNMFDKEVAFAYGLDDKNCLICNKVIFIEGARRHVTASLHTADNDPLRLPDSFLHTSA